MTLAYLVIAATSIWLRQGFATHAIAAAAFDDALFVRLAYALGAGQWLGPFDHLTLAKGMVYPLFMAISAALGLPLKMAEHGLYLIVAASLSLALARSLRSAGFGLVLFALLAFNPVLWHPHLARIIREGLYLTQSLAVLSVAAFLLSARCTNSLQARLGWVFGGGFLLATYWCTREEGVWLVPALLVMVLTVSWSRLHRRARVRSRHERLAPSLRSLLRPIGPLLLAAVVGCAGVAMVKAANHIRYGVFVATEFQDSRFPQAYGALARVTHDQRRPYVIFPADARARAYAVSPALRELRPALEGANSALWREVGCKQMRIAPQDCPEVLSGWFMWALRDATWLAGHYDSAAHAMAFYERLAQEINGACDAGTLACDEPLSGLAPHLDAGRLLATGRAALWLTRAMFQLGDGAIGTEPSQGSLEDLEYLRQMVGPLSPTTLQAASVTLSWNDVADGMSLTPAVQLINPSSDTPARWRLHQEFTQADAPATRLSLLTDCSFPGCQLRLNGQQVPLQRGAELISAQGRLKIEDLRIHANTLEGQRARVQQKIARAMAKTYRGLMPPLASLALLGWVFAILAWRKAPANFRGQQVALVLATGALFAVATRIALLAYLEATAIPSTNMLYASPATPMVLLFTALGLWLGLQRWRTSERRAARL